MYNNINIGQAHRKKYKPTVKSIPSRYIVEIKEHTDIFILMYINIQANAIKHRLIISQCRIAPWHNIRL